jgi:hypothetical protein
MGDIADDAISGAACSDCGCYFTDCEHPPGYPRICAECYEDMEPEDRRDAPPVAAVGTI